MITSNPHDEKPGTCALCHGESHDGSEIELTEHDGEKAVGTYFVCDRCLDARLRSQTWRTATVDALDLLTDAAHLSDDLHPLARAERIAAIIAERDSLRAQLAERQVVVPELTQEDYDLALGCMSLQGRTGAFRAGWAGGMHQGAKIVSSRVRAIDPATECVVSRNDLQTLLDGCMVCNAEAMSAKTRFLAALREGRR